MPARPEPKTPLDTWRATRDETLFLPRMRGRKGAAGEPDSRAARSLPPDLRRQATQRLRTIALIYSAAFFCADLLPTIFMGDPSHRFREAAGWVPDVLSMVFGLMVAAVVSTRRLGWEGRVNLGLLFQIVGSYGIAISQYAGIPSMPVTPHVLHVLAPSWVAIWAIFYSIVVPAPPGRALLAATVSMSAPPVVLGAVLQRAGLSHLLTPTEFFFGLVFPHAICVLLAYAGARVVYRLGTDVSRARELGSYRLVERLGHGGMGEVWKASHQMLARPAAIKLIRPEAIAGASREEAQLLLRRFELEAHATASLTSAHTVELYDFGVTDSGTFYYVMQLLDGVDLERLVHRFGPVPPARIVHLLAQACESLEEAHAKGLIHRDVKPGNIYACRSGNRCDFVKLLDFGLVTRNRSIDALESRLTLPDQATGTPAYMPPELARGEEADGRADIYALGCVAYWLATARPVFAGTSVYDIVSQHLSTAPEPPSRHAPGGLPAELDALILQCLEKSREKRPPDARRLADGLRAVPLRDRWGDEEAEAWWAAHLADSAPAPAPAPDWSGAAALGWPEGGAAG